MEVSDQDFVDKEGSSMSRQHSSCRRERDKHDTFGSADEQQLHRNPSHIQAQSRLMQPGLLKKYAYQGQAWMMELVSGIAFIIIGIIFLGISGNSPGGGIGVFVLGFVLIIHAIYWFMKLKKTEEKPLTKSQSQKGKSHSHTKYESVASAETV